MRRIFRWMAWRLILGAGLAVALPAGAVSITGRDWRVHFNLPDQNSSFGSASVDEFAIRDALVARLNALQGGQRAWLATYTFSGSNLTTGGAGPILKAMEDALNRTAQVAFVADGGISLTTQQGGTNSLAGLAARAWNPLQLVQDDSASGIVHDKLGLFDYGPTNRWVFVTSWNFTGGASTFQWNIGLEVQGTPLFNAYSNEFAELLAGRFHDDTNKSHAHDRSSFGLADSAAASFVRFSPYPDATTGGDHALRDITNCIAGSRRQIVFSLNKLTRTNIAAALVQAADRGVMVHGVIPLSDTAGAGDSAVVYAYLTNAANYASTNVVHLLTAYSRADGSTLDAGETDLVHAKYMVIDPFGEDAVVIHGSANWTLSALQDDNANDENVVFLRHRDVARMFYAHFKRVTGAFAGAPDFWLDPGLAEGRLWAAETGGVYTVEQAATPAGPWSVWQSAITGRLGFVAFSNDANAASRVFRAGR